MKKLVGFKKWARGMGTLAAGLGLAIAGSMPIRPTQAQVMAQSAVDPHRQVTFRCRDGEAAIRALGGPRVTVGQANIYIGYRQVATDNQNPIVARFDNGVLTWCRGDYELSNDDGRGYGLLWDGGSNLYAVFSATGTQGDASLDYRRFTATGWLPSYGRGGGPKVAVIARLDPATGIPIRGTFLTALRNDGSANSLEVTGLRWTGTHLVVTANSWFSPRRFTREAMVCTGTSPFPYQITFMAGLRGVVGAAATGCI